MVKTWLVWSLLLLVALLEERGACGVPNPSSVLPGCLGVAQWTLILVTSLSWCLIWDHKKYVFSLQMRATPTFQDGEKRPYCCSRLGLVWCPAAWTCIL